jgi:hypothetical protein
MRVEDLRIGGLVIEANQDFNMVFDQWCYPRSTFVTNGTSLVVFMCSHNLDHEEGFERCEWFSHIFHDKLCSYTSYVLYTYQEFSIFWMIYLIVDQHDNCTHEKNHSLMFLMWCVQSTNLEEALAWPILAILDPLLVHTSLA